jgi:AraC-like DNA-binding protein
MRHAYGRPINLPDISAQANLSPYHFLRVHKLAYGETPHEFLTRLRIERAKTLLASGSHNVTEACFEVGFSSLGSFSTLFNQRVGLSPSEYRRYVRSSVAVPRTVRPMFVPRASSPCSAGLPKRDESNIREGTCAWSVYLRGEATITGGQP